MLVDREAGKLVEILLFESDRTYGRATRLWTRMRRARGRCTGFPSSASTFPRGS